MITRTAVILSLLAGPALAGSPLNERPPAAPDGVVRIENPAGNRLASPTPTPVRVRNSCQ